MTKIIIMLSCWFAFWSVPARSEPIFVRALRGAVVCVNPAALRDAEVANENKDDKWLRELGCSHVPVNTKAILINRDADCGQLWRLRISLPNEAPQTVWAYCYGFAVDE
jgi:hypothetical protein